MARSFRDALPVTSEGAVACALISLGREDTFGEDPRDWVLDDIVKYLETVNSYRMIYCEADDRRVMSFGSPPGWTIESKRIDGTD